MMELANQSVPAFLELTAGLTAVTCECCDRTEVDDVTHLLAAEAVLVAMSAREEKREADRAAWSDAETAAAEAQRSHQ
jgi:hypothetical protein